MKFIFFLKYLLIIVLIELLPISSFAQTVSVSKGTLYNGHYYVDLGLPSGTLWATTNVGAKSPEEYGNYYAWGETSQKNDYNWTNYKWCRGSKETLNKYLKKTETGIIENNGSKFLNESDDAAHVNWGGEWRMPQGWEWKELINNCNWTIATVGGKKGCKVSSKTNGKSIFLPLAGAYMEGADYSYWNFVGCYWANVLPIEDPAYAGYIELTGNGTPKINFHFRCDGFRVRPVLKSQSVGKQTNSSSTNINIALNGTLSGHSYVDLGLPSGAKWATTNIGTSNPEQVGNYYSWGETTPKGSYFDWDYKWYNKGNVHKIIKYCNTSWQGNVDNKTKLDTNDDAACVNWGSKWRMPSDKDWQELIDECAWTWTKMGEQVGYKVQSKVNSNFIFLPAGGDRDDRGLNFYGEIGYYWTSSLGKHESARARYLGFTSKGVHVDEFYRSRGYCVRPIFF